MPDTIIPPPQPTANFSLPDSAPPDLFNNVAPATNLPPSGADYAKSIASGESIVDLINQVNSIQDQAEGMLGQYKAGSPSSFDIDETSITQRLSQQLNPKEQSLQSFAKPMVLGTERDYNRYKDSKDFQSLGYTPNLGEQQEFKYGNAMSWGETVGKALGGFTSLATDTFVEGWKGWGRMAEALFTWDSSRLMGSPEEREEMARKQEEIFNKYAIYDTAESREGGIFNRQFFGNMLQQSGFAVGALAQFAVEEVLTAGIGGLIKGASTGLLVARTGKVLAKAREAGALAEKTTLLGKAAEGVKSITGSVFKPKPIGTASDLVNSVRKSMDVITSQPKVVNGFANGLKKLIPGYGTVEEIVKLNRAGAGFAQMAYTGIGGIRRGLSEFNMARSESIFEAASTYTDLKDKLITEYYDKKGEYPQGKDLERILQKAEDASHDNFWTNMGVLSVMNRIQFDNMFSSFSKSRSLLGAGAAELEGSAFAVKGINKLGKQEIKTFAKGPLGDISSIGQVAKTFGAKQAAWVATKSIGKGLMKFEGSEGLQELIQTASNEGISDYYYDLYHGKKGYDSRLDAIMGSMKNPLTDNEAMKTFLMGALTGRLISPITGGFTRISESIQDRNKLKKAEASAKTLTEKMLADYKEKNGKDAEGDDLESINAQVKQATQYQTKKQKVQEAIALMNAVSDPAFIMKEAIANVKINNKAAENMEQAAANNNRYVFNNTQGSALAKTVAAAIKLDMYDSLRDMLKEYGASMTDEEFKTAFGMDATDANKKNVKDLTTRMVDNVEDYYNTYKALTDKWSDLIIPELYKNNDPAVYRNAKFQKFVLNNVIEMIATNSFKAKDVIKRASALQTKIASNKNIGGSATEILTKMGNEAFLDDHISLLEKELSDFEKAGVGPLTKEQQELLESKKEELMWAKRLQVSFDGLMGNNDSRINPVLIGEGTELESYSPAAEKRAYEAFAALLNIFNKRAKISTTVSKEDADEVFVDFSDYVKLNRDHSEYIDAINFLADPRNLEAATQAHLSGAISAIYKYRKDHLEELKDATDIDPAELIGKYVVNQEEDGTFTVYESDGITPIATGIATEEEANKLADEKYNEKLENFKLEEEEAKKKAYYSLENTLKRIADAKSADELTAILDDINKNQDLFTDEELNKLLDAEEERNKELEEEELKKISSGIKKVLDKDSPEFLKEYQSVLTDIANIVNKPDVTILEVNDAFKLLTPVLNKLSPADRTEFLKKHLAEQKEILDTLKKELKAKDIAGAKTFITTSLSNDNTPIEKLVQDIADVLDGLSPEFKEEAIQHFEKEYLKAVDRRIATLREKMNEGEIHPYLKSLMKIASDFRAATQLRLTQFEKKSEELAEKRAEISFDIPIDGSFTNPTHRDMLKLSPTASSTIGQKVTIQSFIKSGMLFPLDIENGNTSTLHGASELINMAVARMLTSQVNSAATEFYKKETPESRKKLYEILFSYISDIDEQFNVNNKEKVAQLKENIEGFLLLETKEELLVTLGIPQIDEKSLLSSEDYKIVNEYRNAVAGIMEDSATLGILDSAQEKQNELVAKGNSITAEDIFTKEFVKQLGRFLPKTKEGFSEKIEIFRKDLIETFEKIKGEKDTLKAATLITALVGNHISKRNEFVGRKILQSIMGSALQTDSLLNSDDVIVEPLSEEDMTSILNKPAQSLSKEEVDQIETFAKTTNLENTKKKLNAVAGFETTTVSGDILSNIESFETAKGSVYTVLPDGRTQRFKTATGKQSEANDLIVFVKFTDDAQEQRFLRGVHDDDSGTKVYVIDKEGNKYSKNSDIRGKEVKFALVDEKTGDVLETVETKQEPTIGYSTYDERRFTENGDNYRSKHIGNKVTKINYKKTATTNRYNPEIKPIEEVDTRFNSLRPKDADDNRSVVDLSLQLKVVDGKAKTKTALQFIIDSQYATDAEKALAEKLLLTAGEDDFIVVDNTLDVPGNYDPNNNTATINLEAAAYKENAPSVPVETVILHELMHSVIEKALADPSSEYAKGIKAVFDAMKDVEGASTYYAFQKKLEPDEQLREFVTEAFTNPSFQYLLAKTPYKNTNQSLWDKFLEVISNLFKVFGIDISNTALSEVLSLTNGIMGTTPITPAPAAPKPSGPKKTKTKTKAQDDVVQQKPEGPLQAEFMLDAISKAETVEDLNNLYTELITNEQGYTNKDVFNGLKASIRRKLVSITGFNTIEELKSYTPIKIKGQTYYYTLKEGGLNVVRKAGYKLQNIRKEEVIREVVKEILSKKSINDVLPKEMLSIIKSIGDSAQDAAGVRYSSGQMEDSGDPIGQFKYPNVYGTPIRLPFSDELSYKKFIVDWKKYQKGKLTLDDLKNKYRSSVVGTFGEIYASVGDIAGIRKLINKKYLSLDSGIVRGGVGYMDVEYEHPGEIRDMFADVLNGVDLHNSEYKDVYNYINKSLSKFFGMPISDEFQKLLEGQIFNADDVEVDTNDTDDVDINEEIPAYKVKSDLEQAGYSDDPEIYDYKNVDPLYSISAIESYGLRSSSGIDGQTNKKTGEYEEHPEFIKYYHKVRNIVNKLSVMSPEDLDDLHVTLDMDSADLRWDGSAENIDWTKRAPIGYISDENGNPIVFNEKGEKVGTLDKNNLSDKKGLDNGVNQIVYFTTMGPQTKKTILDQIDKETLKKLFEARERVIKGTPQIAKLTKIGQGQMNVKAIAKKGMLGVKNTLRDKELNDGLKQDHVSFQSGLSEGEIRAIITDSDGGMNTVVLFTPSSRSVKVSSPKGEITLAAHLIDLMKTYIALNAEGYSRIGDLQKGLRDFAYNMWLTGGKYKFKIADDFQSFSLTENDVTITYKLFEIKNGQAGMVRKNLEKLEKYLNNKKLNIYNKWLDGSVKFNFPYITETNGRKMINFEEKNFKDFLMDEAGMFTYISEVPQQEDIKRYNSTVHFSEPKNLEQQPSAINVSEEKILDKPETAVKDAVKEAVNNTKPAEGKVAKSTKGLKKYNVLTYIETYKKTCK